MDKDAQQQELSYTGGRNSKLYSHLEKSLTVFYKVKYTLTIKSIIPLLGIYPNEIITKTKKHLYVNVCNSLSQPKTGKFYLKR